MAQTHRNESAADSATLWAESARRCGYAVHNGSPLIGISGDEGDGFLVPVPAPDYFVAVGDQGTRDNLFRALTGLGLRVGQAKIKALPNPTREDAATAVASALNGSYKPGRTRGDDIVETEALRQFEAHMRPRILAVKADATEAEIQATIAASVEKPAGKEWLEAARARIVETGRYTVSRKKGGKALALDIGL